jgi:hypothetical protein
VEADVDNVDDVDVVHLAAGAAGVGGASEKVKDEDIKPIGGCQLAAMHWRFASRSSAVVLSYCSTKKRKRSTKMMFSSRRRRCWKEACIWEDIASRKTSARAVFIVTMSAVRSCLLVVQVCCVHRRVVVVVGTRGEVGYVGCLRQEGHAGIRVYF